MTMAIAALLLARLALYIFWQYPAPVGDGPLFLAVSHYHCTDGIFRSPIFPIDAELGRYTWHGIFQPALISFLSPDCSIQGHFIALSLLMLATLALAIRIGRSLGLHSLLLPFAAVVFALQAKFGFRPEATAIFLALLTEYLIVQKSKFFLAPLTALAWTHPIGFIVYSLYIAIYQDKDFYQGMIKDLPTHLGVAIGVNAAFLILYPFPMADHLQGMLLQGQKVAATSSAEWPKRLVTYALVSNFFPAIGVALSACLLLLMRQRMRLALMFLVIYYFWARKPELVYNIIPLFAAVFYQVANQTFKGSTATNTSPHKLGVGLIMVIFTLAVAGLTQGLARDIASIRGYASSPGTAQSAYLAWKAQGRVACAVPMHFTLFLPFDQFALSYGSVLKECTQALSTHANVPLFDVYSNSGRSYPEANCQNSHPKQAAGLLGKLFKSDSGYSFSTCTTTAEAVKAYLEENQKLK